MKELNARKKSDRDLLGALIFSNWKVTKTKSYMYILKFEGEFGKITIRSLNIIKSFYAGLESGTPCPLSKKLSPGQRDILLRTMVKFQLEDLAIEKKTKKKKKKGTTSTKYTKKYSATQKTATTPDVEEIETAHKRSKRAQSGVKRRLAKARPPQSAQQQQRCTKKKRTGKTQKHKKVSAILDSSSSDPSANDDSDDTSELGDNRAEEDSSDVESSDDDNDDMSGSNVKHAKRGLAKDTTAIVIEPAPDSALSMVWKSVRPFPLTSDNHGTTSLLAKLCRFDQVDQNYTAAPATISATTSDDVTTAAVPSNTTTKTLPISTATTTTNNIALRNDHTKTPYTLQLNPTIDTFQYRGRRSAGSTKTDSFPIYKVAQALSNNTLDPLTMVQCQPYVEPDGGGDDDSGGLKKETTSSRGDSNASGSSSTGKASGSSWKRRPSRKAWWSSNQHQPFDVRVMPSVAFICDVHAHMANSEIIGFLGGYWDAPRQTLFVARAFPCLSLDLEGEDTRKFDA